MKSRRQILAALLLGAFATALVSCNSGGTSSATSPLDLSPPQSPSNVHSITDPATGRDWLLWTPSASANVAGYEVFCAGTPSGVTTLVSALSPTANDLALPLVGSDTREFYRVRAVGSNHVPSAFTSPVAVDRKGWTGDEPKQENKPGTTGDN